MLHNSLKISSLSLKLIKLHIFKIMYLFAFFNVILIAYHVYAIDAYNNSIIMLKKVFFFLNL